MCCGFLSTFLKEGNAKFQLEVSKNNDVPFFPFEFDGSPEYCTQTLCAGTLWAQVKNPCPSALTRFSFLVITLLLPLFSKFMSYTS